MTRTVSVAEFMSELAAIKKSKAWQKQFRTAYQPISRKAANYARQEMRLSPLRQVVRAADVTRAHATPKAAQIRVGGKRVPYALAAVWGHGGPTGWYGGYTKRPIGWWGGSQGAVLDRAIFNWEKYRQYTPGNRIRPNVPPWVGNSWQIATRGEGPRGINEALAKHQPELVEELADAIDDLLRRAFPDTP